MRPTTAQVRDVGLGTLAATAAASLAVLVITSVTGFHAEQGLANKAIAGRDATSARAFSRVNELLDGQKHLSREVQHVGADNARLRTEVRALVAQLRQAGAVPVVSPASSGAAPSRSHTQTHSHTRAKHVVVKHRTVVKKQPPRSHPTPTPTPTCQHEVAGVCVSTVLH